MNVHRSWSQKREDHSTASPRRGNMAASGGTFAYFIILWFQSYQILAFQVILDTIRFTCYKHSSLTARIRRRVKTKFGRIDFWTWDCDVVHNIYKVKHIEGHVCVELQSVSGI